MHLFSPCLLPPFIGDAEIFFLKGFLRFFMVRVFGDTIHRTDLDTLGDIKMAHAFRAKVGVNDIDLLPLGDGTIGALRFTYIAVDAFVSNNQSHTAKSSLSFSYLDKR